MVNPENYHRLFFTGEKQEAGREALGIDLTQFAPAAHTHIPANIIGLDARISSVVGGLLIEGPGIDLSQDSITGAITIEASGGGSGGLEVRDEGTSIDAAAGFLDFVGAGVAASTVAGGVQVSIPGGAGLDVLDEGSTVLGALATLDFVGAGVTVTNAGGGVAAVSIPGAGGGFRGALVYHSTGQSISGTTDTVLTWDTAAYDTDGCWTISTPTRLTVPAGVSKVRVSASVSMAASGSTYFEIRKNATGAGAGAAFPGKAAQAISTTFNIDTQVATAVIDVTPGDWFDAKLYKTSGTATARAQHSWLSMEIVV